MTEQEQNLAIAEFCGWREAFPRDKTPHPETKRGGILLPYEWVNEITHARAMHLPDYLHDLNAMHEAEKMLRDEDTLMRRYLNHLLTATCYESPKTWFVANFDLQCATAAQRAEALLRTIRKWKD